MSGIYLHIPFCKQACSYCDFFFVTRKGYREAFVDQLLEEIHSYRDTAYAEETVRTIYFGGGTPSLLSLAEIGQIMKALEEVFPVAAQEITLEMNPDDVSREYLEGLRDLGINRSSMGVQSFNPDILEFMHRAHSREEALECFELLRAVGFRTFTVDLIYGNPGQSLQALDDDLDTLLSFEPPHVSAYALTVESGTRLGRQVELGRIVPPGDDMVADHFELVVDRLEKAGIEQYEVSNYSRPGHEAVHNSNYWRHENYLGLGPSAHSFWWDREAVRWNNKADLKAYLDGDAEKLREEKETLAPGQLAEERIMMGLRMREGLTFRELENRYGVTLNERQTRYLGEQEKAGRVALDEEGFSFTRKGMMIADSLLLDLLSL